MNNNQALQLPLDHRRNIPDLVDRQAAADSIEVEYIPGEGRVVTRTPVPERPHAPTEPPPEHASFKFHSCVTEEKILRNGKIQWSREADTFEVIGEGGDTIRILASSVDVVQYDTDHERMLFVPGNETVAETLFHVYVTEFYTFRNLLGARFTPVRVDMNNGRLLTKEEELVAKQNRSVLRIKEPDASLRRRSSQVTKKDPPPRLSKKARLWYSSGEEVILDDLVIRLRSNLTEVPENMLKHNKNDIWDGPFRVIRYPRVGSPGYVKLSFPEDSVADAWTDVEKLILVYKCPPGMNPNDSAAALYRLGRATEWPLNLGRASYGDDDSPLVAKIRPGVYVKCKYVSAGGPHDSLYLAEEPGGSRHMVEKLRAKKIEICNKADYPGEPQYDLELRSYLEKEPLHDSKKVLVVKYLVHWAGWPSEDDTFERAFDNIDKSFIQDFENARGHTAKTILPS